MNAGHRRLSEAPSCGRLPAPCRLCCGPRLPICMRAGGAAVVHCPAGTALQAALTLPGCRPPLQAQVGAAQKGAAAGGGRLRQLQLLRSGCIPLPSVVKHRCRQLAGSASPVAAANPLPISRLACEQHQKRPVLPVCILIAAFTALAKFDLVLLYCGSGRAANVDAAALSTGMAAEQMAVTCGRTLEAAGARAW